MSRILIIDDEVALVLLLTDELQAKGHEVLAAYDGNEGVRLADSEPDLVILDIMMPGMNGFEVCRSIRDRVSCPIIFLSARQSEADRVRGLTLGGDDYVIKPFGLRELLARIEANLRREERARQKPQQQSRLRFGKLELSLKERLVSVAGEPVALTRREYEITELLALHGGQVFSREHIYEKVWGYDAEGDASTVVEHVKKIRAKLAAADPSGDYISTVWGIGYKWTNP
ncbi:chemotaxis protein CheY [Paenibacillus riograndensis]|uniref:Chemotaxis protein CheY n=1 Tax=Paenibacillus riograndensis TaxID=483937 RepID=A0A132U6N7_9BACL|nr:response regulator transcription factor [Paenibacillus riograndensis]KWX78983.1 chemotaxis protein CheY [Paenibacillus riograndensis]KWX86370.1 chemotaxis protein CheY [Paenibacillus riograndensis]